jgi:hypothetical protein
MSKTTIVVESKTRDLLKEMGSKGQTYDQLIKELIKTKRNRDSPGHRIASPDQANPCTHN